MRAILLAIDGDQATLGSYPMTSRPNEPTPGAGLGATPVPWLPQTAMALRTSVRSQ